MKRFRKPWFRPTRGTWFVTIGGKQINLGPNKDQAFQRYHEIMAAPDPQPHPVQSDADVALIDKFLEWVKEHRAARTFEWYQWRLQQFVNTIDRSLLAHQLREYHIDEFLQRHPEWKTGTKHGMTQVVKRVMRWAKKKGYVETNAVADYQKPKAGHRSNTISAEQYQRIQDIAKSRHFRDLVEVTWETGCRPQESLVVEVRHVDIADCRWVFPPEEAKGKQWPRIVYLTERALQITKRLMQQSPTGPLFRNRDGKRWTTYAVNCAWQRIQITIAKQRLRELGLLPPRLERFDRQMLKKASPADKQMIRQERKQLI